MLSKAYGDLVKRFFLYPPVKYAGHSKVKPLKEAIVDQIKPGMTLHTGISHVIPYAAVSELIRQFHAKSPEFSLISLGALNML